ncbi:hypothetical protein LTR78_001867 [Recurvomyces mirabilis]|uniref:Calpain catalytic domain-containing protein n=1 Tax=Recurvomyces mirabilis TaxID=574656 RepID=A0AAE0WVG2_9PEZI|nr:hypothetical protein LTR78_001867 [Recurvomyces mirabilis]KAK5156693.1 hypothetical protein LTS14_004905 [Recurvomyces mirabilis]
MSSSGSDDSRRSRIRPSRRKVNNNDFERVRIGTPPPRPKPKKPPQAVIDDYWSSFDSKHPGKISTVLPNNYHAKKLAQRPDADEGSHNAVASYEEAAQICRQKVDKIVGECRRVNQKYRDPHFDIEHDFFVNGYQECLRGLMEKKNDPKLSPKSVKRVGAIFEKPKFFIKGATANDVRQGRNGDCWLMSALGTITNSPGLIEKICVARDEVVGVYGFVFCRDGAWISEVVDDKLYLMNEDFHDRKDRDDPDGGMKHWSQVQERRDVEREYRRRWQTGSKALYFAQCSDANETWLPLLEKCFAKAHGDYLAVEGGFVGEAIEDLTGGVTSELHGTDILDRDAFWTNELLQVNKQFLFGCGQSRGFDEDRSGIQHRHAYSIMEAREVDGLKLVKLRNPWGNTEWTGAWADGSEEWTGEWLDKLNHKFGNDGLFWILFDDLLDVYQHFDRTRLFDDSWKITQQWISLQVPWSIDYHDTSFLVTVSQPGDVVIVLSQLDDRYFRGLEGTYNFTLHFRVHKEGEADYLVRSPSSYNMRRSISTEVFLEPGSYTIMIKIVATHNQYKISTEDVVRLATKVNRREKLLAVGLSRDLAYGKAQVREHDERVKEHHKHERRAKRKEQAKAAKAFQQHRWSKDKIWNSKQRERFDAKRRSMYPAEPARMSGDPAPGLLTLPVMEIVPAKEVAPAIAVEDTGEPNTADMEHVGDGAPADLHQRIVGDLPAEDAEVVAKAENGLDPTSAETGTDAANVGPGISSDEAAELSPEDVDRHPASRRQRTIKTAQTFASDSTIPSQEEQDNAETLNSRDTQTFASDTTNKPAKKSKKKSRSPRASFQPPSRQNTNQSDNPDYDRYDDPAQFSRGPTRQTTFATINTAGGAYSANGPQDQVVEADLSWDSDLDAPSDSDADEAIRGNPFVPPRPPPPPPPPGNADPLAGFDLGGDGKAEDSQFATEPWNAVVVVGLRVYAKVDNEVGVEVRWPGRRVKGREGEGNAKAEGLGGEEGVGSEQKDEQEVKLSKSAEHDIRSEGGVVGDGDVDASGRSPSPC